MGQRKRYPKQEWHDFGKRVLLSKGGTEQAQREFLEACCSKEEFLEYMDDYLPVDSIEGCSALGDFDYRFSEHEFIEPPPTTQKEIREGFALADGGGNEELYADVCFWGVVMREMVERGLVQASWLAANASDTHDEAGLSNIEDALSAEDDASAKARDRCVRRILRSLCNPEPRGARVVFDDFPLGKSWWRLHWAERMAELLGIGRDDILQILTGPRYAIIAEKMHSGRSYLSPENVFGGLILFLREEESLPAGDLPRVIDALAAQSAWRAIELRSPKENRDDLARLNDALTSAPI